MKLIDFVILLLRTHATSLRALSNLFSEEILLEILERAEDRAMEPCETTLPALDFHPDWLLTAFKDSTRPAIGAEHFKKIKEAVRLFRLSPVLEFYVWAYPFYRVLIESPLDLNVDLSGTRSEDPGIILCEKAMQASKNWIKHLSLSPEYEEKARSKIECYWKDFREQVLKRMSARPFMVK